MLGARKTRRQTLAHIKWPFYTGAGASHSVEEISRGIEYIHIYLVHSGKREDAFLLGGDLLERFVQILRVDCAY